MFYEDSGGTGPAIIISHGFLMDHRMFDAQVEALSDYRLIRWDTRNHGRSHGNATAYSFWDQARDGLAILDHLGVPFETVDVLQDAEVRQGIKEYSDWPTIPQLYVKGEFVGGSDIMMEMFEAGELQQLFADRQIARA